MMRWPKQSFADAFLLAPPEVSCRSGASRSDDFSDWCNFAIEMLFRWMLLLGDIKNGSKRSCLCGIQLSIRFLGECPRRWVWRWCRLRVMISIQHWDHQEHSMLSQSEFSHQSLWMQCCCCTSSLSTCVTSSEIEEQSEKEIQDKNICFTKRTWYEVKWNNRRTLFIHQSTKHLCSVHSRDMAWCWSTTMWKLLHTWIWPQKTWFTRRRNCSQHCCMLYMESCWIRYSQQV